MKPATDAPRSLLDVDSSLQHRLRDFLGLLCRWNRRINLVADAPAETLWERHVIDSLQLVPLLPPEPAPLLDIGSGAGFPGLVLAAATGQETHLVESDRRKAAFLGEAARVLALSNVWIHAVRIEALPPTGARVVTARALAPLPILLSHAWLHLAQGGVALFPKGRAAEQELTVAAVDWTMRVERFPSWTDPAATILRLGDIRPARTSD